MKIFLLVDLDSILRPSSESRSDNDSERYSSVGLTINWVHGELPFDQFKTYN